MFRLRVLRLRALCRSTLPRRATASDQGEHARRLDGSMARELDTLPGQRVLLSKMAEALFVQTLRRYMESLPPEQTGWLAAARDPIVGAALAAMHATPGAGWTQDELARCVATSKSVLGKRFETFLHEPPLTYLARWRLQLAARALQTSRKPVGAIAAEVGYTSQAAFNRAFKREFGMPPVQYRRSSSDAGPEC